MYTLKLNNGGEWGRFTLRQAKEAFLRYPIAKAVIRLSDGKVVLK